MRIEALSTSCLKICPIYDSFFLLAIFSCKIIILCQKEYVPWSNIEDTINVDSKLHEALNGKLENVCITAWQTSCIVTLAHAKLRPKLLSNCNKIVSLKYNL